MSLCSNRPEGFGPSSIISSGLPTSCFSDTILIPLPVWLFLGAIAVLPLIYRHRQPTPIPTAADPLTITSPAPSSSSAHSSNAPITSPTTPYRTTILHKITAAIYHFLLFAILLMATVELVRLDLNNMGLALLPFEYIALILATIIHTAISTSLFSRPLFSRPLSLAHRLHLASVPRPTWLLLLISLWAASMLVNIIKAAALARMFNRGSEFGDLERADTPYPLSDQVLDVAVIAGCYGAIAILEGLLGVWRGRRSPVAQLESGEKR